MFRETLLESAPGARRRKRWPMVLAVVLEVTVCGVLVALPLFSTGIIPISARTPVVLPMLDHVRIAQRPPNNATENTGHGVSAPRTLAVVTFGTTRSLIDRTIVDRLDSDDSRPDIGVAEGGKPLPNCEVCLETTRRPPQHSGPYKVSDGVSEGYLLRRVEPVYPRPAILAGIRGEVRLHAIIGKDGTIQSLTVISGHPLLVTAAVDAVQQWRYRPYLLNHEPVDVETLITVNFNNSR